MRKLISVSLVLSSVLWGQVLNTKLDKEDIKSANLTLKKVERTKPFYVKKSSNKRIGYSITELEINSNTDSVSYVDLGNNNGYFIIFNTDSGGDVCPHTNITDFNLNIWGQPYNNDYYNSTVTHSNSFGGWFYFDSQNGGYNGGCHLASRSSSTIFFNFQLKSNGILSITSQMTNYSTYSVVTTEPVPTDEWVYIQGYQSGYNYTVGWKKADGTENVSEKTIIPHIDIHPWDYSFPLDCVNEATELFWQPGVQMFELMSDSSLRSKELYYQHEVAPSYNVNTQNFLVDLTLMLFDQPSPITREMIDTYQGEDGLFVVDLRDETCPTTTHGQPPIN